MFGGLLLEKPGDEEIEETDSAAPKEGEKEEEVREHMADILLAKNKLSSLQKQVKEGGREGSWVGAWVNIIWSRSDIVLCFLLWFSPFFLWAGVCSCHPVSPHRVREDEGGVGGDDC